MTARKTKGLTERHKKILVFFEDFQDRNGYPPSIREICQDTGISSTSVANYYLDQLVRMGYIERDQNVSRGMRLTQRISQAVAPASQAISSKFAAIEEMLRIPLAGQIVASEPVPMPGTDFSYFDAESNVEIARSLLPVRDTANLFALKVKGDSMIDAMVNDGDIVILQPATEAKNGEMVAVWLPEKDETTLKYFYKETDGFRLQPANPTMKPIRLSKKTTVEIRGKVIMVVRQIPTRM